MRSAGGEREREDAPLPSDQHRYEDLPVLAPEELHRRRERVFLACAGLFLGTLAMLNILGVTRFIDLSVGSVPIILAVGVLPYPVTFLCTDFISELYGPRRASQVVWMGLALNVWVLGIIWLGGALPGVEGQDDSAFVRIRTLATGGVLASMVAYLTAQLVDVHLFHFWKRATRGGHLWLRNNGSTVVSQGVDTVAVIVITYAVGGLPIDDAEPVLGQLLVFIYSGYTFKLVAALLDTGPFYLGAHFFTRYLRLPPPRTGHSRTGHST